MVSHTVCCAEIWRRDRDAVPTAILAAGAAFIAWRSRRDSHLAVRMAGALGGLVLSSLVTHRKLRQQTTRRLQVFIPDAVQHTAQRIDDTIGQSGVWLWNRVDTLHDALRRRL